MHPVIYVAILTYIGKCILAVVLYFISARLQMLVVSRYGKYLSVTEAQIEAFAQRFGKGWRDDITLFLLRAIPFVPSIPVSVGSGILKLNFRTYMVATVLGTLVRESIYYYLGYIGYSFFVG